MKVLRINLTVVSTVPLSLLFLTGGGCGGDDGTALSRSLDLSPITDIDPSPEVVEVDLIAGAGETRYLADGAAEIWSYKDGARADARVMVPGPLIEVKKGATVIVHFTNQLPEATTIHWHGVRVPNGADGTLSTQTEVPAGGSFDYRFTAIDAGTFWYHPHMRGDVQVERGLYGVLEGGRRDRDRRHPRDQRLRGILPGAPCGEGHARAPIDDCTAHARAT